jgi:acetyltransferase-like isoleucine patch superfamily enzyme
MKNLISFFDKVLYKWQYSKLNIIKTLIFNLRTMPFKVAIKFPVLLYGKVDLYLLKGDVEFQNCKIVKGMIKMGMNKEFLGIHKGASLIILREKSKLIFQGPSEFSSNFLVRTGKGAKLTIGEATFFGSTVKLVCIYEITIGKGSRIAFESQVIDSDFHYTYNLDRQEVKPREKAIHIGQYNWIGNRTTISKGATTNPFTIVTSASILNKNYTKLEDKFVVLGGQPAKQISKNIRRIYPLDIEEKLVSHFEKSNESFPIELKHSIEQSFL